MDSSWRSPRGFRSTTERGSAGNTCRGLNRRHQLMSKPPFLLLVRGTESFYTAMFCSLSTSYEMSCAELQYQAFDSGNLGRLCELSTECLGSLVLAEYARSLESQLRASHHSPKSLVSMQANAASYHTWRATKCSCTTGKGRRHACPNILGIVCTARR